MSPEETGKLTLAESAGAVQGGRSILEASALHAKFFYEEHGDQGLAESAGALPGVRRHARSFSFACEEFIYGAWRQKGGEFEGETAALVQEAADLHVKGGQFCLFRRWKSLRLSTNPR